MALMTRSKARLVMTPLPSQVSMQVRLMGLTLPAFKLLAVPVVMTVLSLVTVLSSAAISMVAQGLIPLITVPTLRISP